MCRRTDGNRPGLVTIASFRSPGAAHFHRSRLELEGIPAFVADEHLISLGPFYSAPVGGVKLQVSEFDVERALAVLREGPAGQGIDEEAPSCPECNSLDVRAQGPSWLTVIAAALLLGIPLLFRRRQWVCGSCGHRWVILGR